jgi:hypothetical protein
MHFTNGLIKINWRGILGDRAMFARDLTNEKGEGGEYRSDTSEFIAETCRDIRKTLPNNRRGLIITKFFNLI